MLAPLLLAILSHPNPPKRDRPISGLADQVRLTAVAKLYHIPPIVLWTIAQKESGVSGRNNILGPGQLSLPLTIDSVRSRMHNSIAVIDTFYHRWCREIGRMQINPCVQDINGVWHWKPNHWRWLSKFCAYPLYRDSYNANVRCDAAITYYHYRMSGSWESAFTMQNGHGSLAAKYQKNCSEIVGQIVLRLLRHRSQSNEEWREAMGDFLSPPILPPVKESVRVNRTDD